MKTYISFNMKAIIRLASIVCFLFVGIGQMWGVETFIIKDIASAKSWSNETAYTSWTSSIFTFSASGGGNNGKYYSSNYTWRFYTGGTATITPSSGYEIVSVTSEPKKAWSISNTGVASHSVTTNTSFTSITVTYKSTSGSACGSIDVTGGSAVILPSGSWTDDYATKDWRYAGSPVEYGSEATMAIGANNYCMTFSNAYDANGDAGLQVKASGGYVSIAGITSNYGIDVDIQATGTNNFTVSLTGAAANVTGNNTTLSISTTSTTATLTITKSTSSAGYIKKIRITPKAAPVACSADPTIGAASLSGSFNSGGVTSLENTVSFSTTSCDPKTNCEWVDYGFVWGTSASPTVSNTKMQKGTSGDATSWEMTSPSTFTVNTTYKVRAYGKNGKTGAEVVYSSSDLSFTPLSVAFNSNGGSAVATKYIKSGGTITSPGAPATPKTGYAFDSWRTDAGLGTAVNFSSAVNSSTTYYAKWNPNNYTITLNDGDGSGGSGSVTATFDANTNLTSSVDVPTRTDYIFGGYWTGDNGTGTQIIDDEGAFIASAGGGSTYTDASKNWKYANNITLKAKWTEHTYINYRTVCCTELGTIDGEASLTQAGNSVTISGWSDVSNVGTYTVKLYKKNGASWDLVSGTASGGSAGTAGTRTGITSGSKLVTYTGLVVESEYKFTVQAIAGSSAYCDGAETAITEINSTDVSSTPFKFRYSIYIDNGSGSGWAHHYIEPTGNTDEGSVSIDLNAHVTSYEFKIYGGFTGNWGQTGSSAIPASTKWTLNGSFNVKLNTGAGGSYTFTVDYSGTTNPGVTVTFPSADQDAGYVIYYDNSVLNWSSLYYRVGNNSSCSKVDVSLVPGTDKFYKVTTPDYDNMDAWHLANNYGWTGSNSIYRTKTSSDPAESPKAITNSIAFQQYAVTEDITVIPTTTHSTGTDTGDAGNSNCEFYTINTPTSGMLTHNAAITSYSHGTVTVAYTNTSGSAASFTSGNADLAHRCKLTITATPATGYSLSSLQVNSSNFTSGNEHILTADATITAVFTAQTSTVTLQATSATTGSDQTVLATYDASMPLVTTADKTPAVAAISRTGYTFNGWWDATSSGKQYYSHSAGTIASANNWDKTGTQTLYAQWIAKEYTITLDREGGSTGAESATATFDSGTLTGWSAPTKTGYTFGGYYSGDNGTGTLVISTAGVLQNSVTISAVNWTDASGHWIKDGGVTLYAKWTADEYTISYKDEGNVAYSGSNSALLPTTHTYGAATDLVDGVKSGYRFDGWFDNSSCTGSAITTIGATAITANTTYYAKWTEVYTVTWHVNGEEYSTGVVTGNSQVPDGEKISDVPTAPADNTLNNCANKFMGWSAKDAGSTAKTTSYYDDLFTDVEGSPTISDDIDFYAVFAERDGAAENTTIWSENWTGATYSNGSTGMDDAKPSAQGDHSGKTVYGGATITYTQTSNGTYVRNDNNAGGSAPELMIKASEVWTVSGIPSGGATTLTVSYKQNGQSLTVAASGTSYSGSKTSSTKATQSFDVTVGSTSTFTLTFTAGSSNVRVDNVEVKVKTTSYSNYVTECAANQVRVAYDFNGGTGTACSEGVTTKNANYTVCSTTPTKNYYDFGGWNDGTSTYNAGATGYNLASSTTFTAQWTPTTYDITYELDGGTNSGSNPATYNVTTATITLQNPTRDHDRFDGWFTDDGVWSDEVTEIPNGSHGNITLYAKWTERHEIVFDYSESASSGTTTIYRADDEDLSASVAGQGSVPSDPSAPTACSSKVFVGWSESPIDDETDDEPGDLMKPAAGTVDADKHYYAVWAIESSESGTVYLYNGSFEEVSSGTDYGDKGKWTTSKVYGTGTAGEVRMSSGSASGSMDLDLSDKTLATTITITFKMKRYGTEAGTVTLSCMDDGSTASFGSSPFSYPSGDDNWHDYSSTVTSVNNAKTNSIHFTSTSGKRVYVKDVVVSQIGTVYNYSAYSTSCCATKVTLSQNSPEHGTIAFGKAKVPTCGDKEVSLTITPAVGYQLHTYEVATGSGKVGTKSVSPAISLDNNSSAAQNITLTFADEANGAYDVTASFSKMAPTAWAWTYKSEAIPNPINLYVGQTATLNATYTPSGLLNSEQNYNVTKSANLTQTSKTYATPDIHYTFRADATMDDGTVTLTNQINSSLTITVHVHVDPLPLTHFEDLVHGKAFADVEATLVDNALSATKTTPTSDDWVTPNANSCEENHLHLVGWIREDWPALVAYLNGTGDAPTTTAIVGAGNDGSGNAYFFAPNASINVQTFNDVTFYAVWAEIK